MNFVQKYEFFSDWGKVKEFMEEKGVNSFGAIGRSRCRNH